MAGGLPQAVHNGHPEHPMHSERKSTDWTPSKRYHRFTRFPPKATVAFGGPVFTSDGGDLLAVRSPGGELTWILVNYATISARPGGILMDEKAQMLQRVLPTCAQHRCRKVESRHIGQRSFSCFWVRMSDAVHLWSIYHIILCEYGSKADWREIMRICCIPRRSRIVENTFGSCGSTHVNSQEQLLRF